MYHLFLCGSLGFYLFACEYFLFEYVTHFTFSSHLTIFLEINK